ncbi:MAG: hypothetical protein ACT4PJ_08540 [Gemmatimonadaceae bacterium]
MKPTDRPWEWEDVRATASARGVHLEHVRERAALELRDGRLRRGTGYAGASRTARRSLARVGAILRLRSRGRYLIHASAVVDHAGDAWLLTGESGSGKSTLAWVLVRQGWSLLGDDGVVVESTESGPVARAWRDPLRVSLALADRFPELRHVSDRAAPGDARHRVPVERDVVRKAARVRVVLCLERAARDTVMRLTPAMALASLVRQSPWVLIDDDDAARHLSLLAELARRVPAFRVAHTDGQLDAFPRTVASLA